MGLRNFLKRIFSAKVRLMTYLLDNQNDNKRKKLYRYDACRLVEI